MTITTQKPPAEMFHFLAGANINALSPDGKRTLTGIAYSGEIITDHHYFSRVVFDLSTTQIDPPLPLLDNHNHDCVVGVITEVTTNHNISITGTLFTGIDDEADEIANKADAGMPWQLSVGIIWPGEIIEVQVGSDTQVNGQTFAGPLIVFKNSRVREVM